MPRRISSISHSFAALARAQPRAMIGGIMLACIVAAEGISALLRSGM
ncbi:hypothetical protein ACFOKI_15265 [Sphingomonas qilianensis]|uniref:Uncharacterized protein n=1 Tax=Sphingomonas qilianensis TaxID=1736690 RepID=A0ABU9XM79_9SPHN